MPSTLVRVSGSRALNLGMVAPQILDSQLFYLDSLERPSRRQVEAQLSLLLLLFPSILVNVAYLEEHHIFGDIPPEALRSALSSGAITVLTSSSDPKATGDDITWEQLEAASEKRIENAPPVLQDAAREQLQSIRNLDTRVHYMHVDIPPLAKSFRSRISRLANAMHHADSPNDFIRGDWESNQRDAMLRAASSLSDLAGSPDLSRRLVYNEHKLEKWMERKEMPLTTRLVKAAADVAYTSNAPSALGLSTCYSITNRPYEIASIIRRKQRGDKGKSPSKLPLGIPLRFPSTLSEALELRARQPASYEDSLNPVENFEEYLEIVKKRITDFKLDKGENSRLSFRSEVDQLGIWTVRFHAESDVQPIEMSVVVPERIGKGELTTNDIQELQARSRGNSVLPSKEFDKSDDAQD